MSIEVGSYVYDTTRRKLVGRVLKVCRTHVTIETKFRASPTGPWFTQEHRIRKVNTDLLPVPTLDPRFHSSWEYTAAFRGLVDGSVTDVLFPREVSFSIGDRLHISEQTWPDRRNTGRSLQATVLSVTEENDSVRLQLRIDSTDLTAFEENR